MKVIDNEASFHEVYPSKSSELFPSEPHWTVHRADITKLTRTVTLALRSLNLSGNKMIRSKETWNCTREVSVGQSISANTKEKNQTYFRTLMNEDPFHTPWILTGTKSIANGYIMYYLVNYIEFSPLVLGTTKVSILDNFIFHIINRNFFIFNLIKSLAKK